MSFGPKRGHVMFIFERFFRDFGLLIVYLLLYLVIRDVQILLDNIALAVLAFFLPVTRTVKYLTTYYTIDREKLLIKSGLLNKKTQEIPLANITAVDFTQPMILQIAKVYCIHVENASSLGDVEKGTVKIVLGEEDAVLVKRLLLAKHESYDIQVETPESLATYKASLKEVVLMGLLQVKVLVLLIQMAAFLGAGAGILASVIEKSDGEFVEELVIMLLDNLGVMLVIYIVIALYLVSLVIGALMSIIKFYGFRITDRGNSLFVEYGLFTKNTHTIMKEKISGIYYRQSILMRIIKRGTLEVFAAGYGGMDEGDREEAVMLYPVIPESKVYGFLENILPGFAEEPEYETAPGNSLPYYFICGRFIAAVVVLAGTLMIPEEFVIIRQCVIAVAVLLVLLAVASVVLEYRNAAVSAATKMIVLRNGGFTRNTFMLVRDKIEYAEDRASNRKRRRIGVSSITVGVLAPNQYSSHKVRNMKLEVFDAVKGRLMY